MAAYQCMTTVCLHCLRGEDLFGLEQHFHNWLQTPADFDVLFIR